MARDRAIALRGTVLRGARREDGAVALRGAHIAEAAPGSRTLALPEHWMIAPGLVDIQVNGFGGVEVGGDPGALHHIALALPSEGVTAFCPTLVSTTERDYRRAAVALRAAGRSSGGAHVLAPHLEGPFLAPERAGAHRVETLRYPDPEPVSRLLALFRPSVVTLAPELPGALAAIVRIARSGAVPALGHTSAGADVARAAIGVGARLLTHAPNAMRGIEARKPSALVAFLGHRRAYVSMIADGVHVDPEVLDVLANVLRGRALLISDASAAAGAPPGDYALSGRTLRSDGRRVTTAGGVLAGSACGLAAGPQTLARAGARPHAALAAASVAPRRLLGLPWRLRPGDPADLTIVDENLTPQLTLIGGKARYAGASLPESLRAAFS